jgi:hypothetical protein
MGVVLERQLGERCPLHVQEADRVERDVDAAGALGHRVGVRVDGLLVQRVDLRCLDLASRGGDLPGDLVQLGERARRVQIFRQGP